MTIAALPAAAQDRHGIRAMLEQFQVHRRIALGYLQTGNADLAVVELERLRGIAGTAAGATSPAGSEPALAAVLVEVRAGVGRSIEVAEGGDLDHARALLIRSGEPLDIWRRNAGLTMFSDCIARVGGAYETLDIYRKDRPDLSDLAVARRIVEAAASTEQMLARCDAEASAATRAEPEFRRLIDGFTASLKLVPDAIARRDGDYLYRLLIEQRSLERLLAFRYG
jgi:hypothetical protein